MMPKQNEGSWKFKRAISDDLLAALLASNLFDQRLKPDIMDSFEVFPAFRNNSIGFYHRGGRLFEFNKDGFRTHVKYASVLDGYNKDYICAPNLQANAHLIKNFEDGYKRIKENCALFAGVESSGVSKIYERSSYLNTNEDIVVLDVEVSLKAIDDAQESEFKPIETERKRTQDRIDLLLYQKSTGTLRFYEAKHFSNPEIWSNPGALPKVAGQLKRYDEQLSQRHEDVMSQYQDYILTARRLFNLTPEQLPDPAYIEKDVVLLVFGFDDLQKTKLNKLLIDDFSLANHRYRFIGSPKNAADLWNNVKLGKSNI
jgi:hypothetical protein